MTRTGGEVSEERLVGLGGSDFTQVTNRAVGQIFTQVIALFGTTRRIYRGVVLPNRGDELVYFTPVKSVPALKPAPARPRSTRSGGVSFIFGS